MSIEPLRVIENLVLDVEGIKKLIPHRYPMLMIEKLTQIVPNESAVGIKNVSINEPFFAGHFPNQPVMPGVLVIEAMAQTAASLVIYSLGELSHGNIVLFLSIADARFRKPVLPGDTLQLKVKKTHRRSNVWKFEGKACVNDIVYAEALYTAMIVEQD